MRQTYLTSDNPTVVNRLRKSCHEYARQRELEEWFENIHHVRLAWKEDADGKRKSGGAGTGGGTTGGAGPGGGAAGAGGGA